MKVYKLIYIFTVLCVIIGKTWVNGQDKLELNFHIGYSKPLLEAYGTNVTLSSTKDYILIDGKRLINSNNLGTEQGITVQTYIKYSVIKNGYLKALFNLGYNNLYSSHEGPEVSYGIRIQSFSIGLGAEICPLGNKIFYPAVFALIRTNFVGGESFNYTGLDFFKVTPRYGYSGGLNLNYRFNKKTGMYAGWTYNYDNTWSKQTDETVTNDVHTIVFRDKANSINGLQNDRRIAYSSFYIGMNFYIK